MIAALTALLFGYDPIVLSNERSASEGNVSFDGREINHQHSKSFGFERAVVRPFLPTRPAGRLRYFSLLRPYSEARIAELFARETRFDHVVFELQPQFQPRRAQGRSVVRRMPEMPFRLPDPRARTWSSDAADRHLRPQPARRSRRTKPRFRELTGLAGQKPWECVGEILEAAACLDRLRQPSGLGASRHRHKRSGAISTPSMATALEAALDELFTDSDEPPHPADVRRELFRRCV